MAYVEKSNNGINIMCLSDAAAVLVLSALKAYNRTESLTDREHALLYNLVFGVKKALSDHENSENHP